jgi:outer membrane protein assembly factor BamB
LIAWIGVASAQIGPPTSKRPALPPPDLAAGNKVPSPSPPFRSKWALTLPHSNQVMIASGAINFFVSSDTTPLHAYALTDGRPAWQSPLKADQPMAVGDDLVFVPQGDSIHALEQATGRTRWTIVSGALAVAPAWQPQWLFTSAKDGTVAAWRVTDGTQVWKQALGAPAASRLSVDGERLFLGLTDKRLVSLHITDGGKPLWTTTLLGVAREIAAIDGHLYFGASDYTFYSVDQDSGEFEWTHKLIHSTVIGRPVLDENHIWIGTLNNRADALARHNGQIDIIKNIPGRPAEQIVMEGGNVIVPLESGDLMFFTQKDGKPVRPTVPTPATAAGAANAGPPPPPPEAKVAPRLARFLALPPLDGITPDGVATPFVTPIHAAMPSPPGTALKAPLLLAGPPNAQMLLKVTVGPDAVHTVTAFERDKRIDTRACLFEWAYCESRTLGLPVK